MLLLKVFLAATTLIVTGVAEAQEDYGFGADVAAHFTMPPAPDHVHEIAEETGKPVMVFLMNKISPICNTLKKAIKNGSKVKALLGSFTVAYAEENTDKWSEDKYVPQVMFFSGKKNLGVESGHKSGKYLYTDETKLEAAMTQALAKAKSAKSSASSSNANTPCWGHAECEDIDEKDFCESTQGCTWGKTKSGGGGGGSSGPCSGGPDCDGIDDKDFCESTDGCSWNAGGGGGGPCQGGSQCKGIDDQDFCEETAGCSWDASLADDDFEDNDSNEGGGGGGGSGEEHKFSEEILAKIMENPQPSAVRKAAKEKKKPFMVLLTQPWCGPCKDLIKGMNGGNRVKPLLDKWVFVHASGDQGLMNWQNEGENYVPQAYFYDFNGAAIKVKGPQEKFPRFFSSEYELFAAMEDAYKKVSAKNEL